MTAKIDNVPPNTIFHCRGSFKMSILKISALKGTVKIKAEAFSEPNLDAAIKNAVVAKAIAPTEMASRFSQKMRSNSKTVKSFEVSVKTKANAALSR